MGNDFLDEVKSVIESGLPSSAATISKVIQVMLDQSSNARTVATIIKRDPNLAADILRTANSAYYGCSGTIASIQRAVVIIGYDTIKELISTIGLLSCFTGKNNTDESDITGLLYHSIGSAKACQIITQEMHVWDADSAYTAGLLHDIGKIILALYFPEYYEFVSSFVKEKNTRFILAERRRLKADHTKIGKLLCDSWSLPESIGIAILDHHDPLSGKKDDQIVKYAQIVELGDFFCRKAAIGFPGDEKTVQPPVSTMALLGVKPEKREENYAIISEKLEKSKPEIENYFCELKQNNVSKSVRAEAE